MSVYNVWARFELKNSLQPQPPPPYGHLPQIRPVDIFCHLRFSVAFGGGRVGARPLNARTAVAEPRFSFKGGEEKSPYCVYFSTPRPTLLDGERTIALLLFDRIETFSFSPKPETGKASKTCRVFSVKGYGPGSHTLLCEVRAAEPHQTGSEQENQMAFPVYMHPR